MGRSRDFCNAMVSLVIVQLMSVYLRVEIPYGIRFESHVGIEVFIDDGARDLNIDDLSPSLPGVRLIGRRIVRPKDVWERSTTFGRSSDSHVNLEHRKYDAN